MLAPEAIRTASFDALWEHYQAACSAGQAGPATWAADELLSRAERGEKCPDMLSDPSDWGTFDAYTPGMLQGLTDRVREYNRLVLR